MNVSLAAAAPCPKKAAFFGQRRDIMMQPMHVQSDADMPHPSETTGEYLGIGMFFGLILGLLIGIVWNGVVLTIAAGLLLGALLGALLDHHYKSKHREETFPG
jgi:hypothetical protein